MRNIIKLVLAGLCLASGVASAAPFGDADSASASTTDFQISHNYQKSASTTCAAATACDLVFPAPKNDTIILAVSCRLQLGSQGNIAYAYLGGAGLDSANLLIEQNYNGALNYVLSANTHLFIPAGQKPQVNLYADGAPVASQLCTISGYHK
jgi:hypothetical protein